MRPLLITLAAAAVAATVSLACGQDEEALPPVTATAPAAEPTATGGWSAPSGTPVPKPGWKTTRFLNVTASTPDGMQASRLYWGSDSKLALVIEPYPIDGSHIAIDAETGTVIEEAGSEQERAALQPALDTVRISPFDPKSAPWPYEDTAPPGQRGGWGAITYPEPDPLSGIGIGMGSADGGPPGQCNSSILVGNGRSKMAVSACTGEPFPKSMDIHPQDADAFQRFLKAIEVKP